MDILEVEKKVEAAYRRGYGHGYSFCIDDLLLDGVELPKDFEKTMTARIYDWRYDFPLKYAPFTSPRWARFSKESN